MTSFRIIKREQLAMGRSCRSINKAPRETNAESKPPDNGAGFTGGEFPAIAGWALEGRALSVGVTEGGRQSDRHLSVPGVK